MPMGDECAFLPFPLDHFFFCFLPPAAGAILFDYWVLCGFGVVLSIGGQN